MIIVTSGAAYLDIDAWAGCIAYAELLNLLGKPAKAAGNAPPNASVTPSVLSWGASFSSHQPAPDDQFILVDVSDVHCLESHVDPDRVIEVIDHHAGYEEFWQRRLGEKSCIERIGAACTMVFERWQAASSIEKMSVASTRLMLTAILDNTLHFLAQSTTLRDIAAYGALVRIAGLPDDWAEQYFSECQEAMERNLFNALRSDTKLLAAANLPRRFGQLTAWHGRRIVFQDVDAVRHAMDDGDGDWVVNIVSLADERSYLVAGNAASEARLRRTLAVDFSGGVADCGRLLLRKEIMRMAAVRDSF